ncbi:MAG: hypothetical protein NTZ18_00595 [Candidatus Komeilibacteria bacterium]|nr:hypothetical protein [Candidatus Komeilibacteria bacterium]
MEEYKIDDVSEDQLKTGYWLLTHQQQLKKFLVGFLIFTAAAIWAIVIYGLTVFISQSPQDQAIVSGIINSHLDFADFRAKIKPQPLEFSAVQIIYTGNDKYDFVAEAFNPNERRGVLKLTYQFLSGDYLTPTATAVILPKQKIYLFSLANDSLLPLSSVTLKIKDVVWADLAASGKFSDPLFNFSEIGFRRDQQSGRFSAAFTATNNTLANFWSVDLQAVLFSGSAIIGVNQINLERFLGEEKRDVTISWFERLPQVTGAAVVPVVDVYDPANFFTTPGLPQNPEQ